MELKVVLEPSDEGGFTVYVPALPGCVSEGKTREEALRNIREAVELYLEPVDDDLVARPNSPPRTPETERATASTRARNSGPGRRGWRRQASPLLTE